MRRSNKIAAMLLGGFSLAALSAHAKQRDVKTVYCVPRPDKSWSLQRYKPLIDPHARTVFAEMTFADHEWLEIRLRRFSAASEVAFAYKFDTSGRLNALEGTVKVFGSWVGEANLFPDPDGTVPAYRVLYSRNNERVQRPEDAADYIALLDQAPVYKTVQSAPCAAMMKEAEGMNATQE